MDMQTHRQTIGQHHRWDHESLLTVARGDQNVNKFVLFDRVHASFLGYMCETVLRWFDIFAHFSQKDLHRSISPTFPWPVHSGQETQQECWQPLQPGFASQWENVKRLTHLTSSPVTPLRFLPPSEKLKTLVNLSVGWSSWQFCQGRIFYHKRWRKLFLETVFNNRAQFERSWVFHSPSKTSKCHIQSNQFEFSISGESLFRSLQEFYQLWSGMFSRISVPWGHATHKCTDIISCNGDAKTTNDVHEVMYRTCINICNA